jgi:hypothetical protein
MSPLNSTKSSMCGGSSSSSSSSTISSPSTIRAQRQLKTTTNQGRVSSKDRHLHVQKCLICATNSCNSRSSAGNWSANTRIVTQYVEKIKACAANISPCRKNTNYCNMRCLRDKIRYSRCSTFASSCLRMRAVSSSSTNLNLKL